jgi:hypothetical protein
VRRQAGTEHPASPRENFTDIDPVGGELVARSLDVRDDQVQALGQARRGRCDVRAELDRATGPRRRKLDDPKAVIEAKIGVEPPTELPIELLGAVDIRNRDDDRFELHVDSRDARDKTAYCICVHGCLQISFIILAS